MKYYARTLFWSFEALMTQDLSSDLEFSAFLSIESGNGFNAFAHCHLSAQMSMIPCCLHFTQSLICHWYVSSEKQSWLLCPAFVQMLSYASDRAWSWASSHASCECQGLCFAPTRPLLHSRIAYLYQSCTCFCLAVVYCASQGSKNCGQTFQDTARFCVLVWYKIEPHSCGMNWFTLPAPKYCIEWLMAHSPWVSKWMAYDCFVE